MKEQMNLEQMEEAAREQKTGERIDEYTETLNQIFDALLPEERFSPLLGSTEYNQLRQDYKRVHHAYYSQQIASISEDHAAEINMWCDKFSRLTSQSMEVENQRQKLEVERDDARTAAQSWERRAKELEEQLEKSKSAETENVKLRQRIVELEAHVERLQTPKEPAKTEALDNVLSEIKSRKQMDADELWRRFEERQRNGGKIMVIDHSAKKVELPELPFRPMDTTPSTGVSQFPAINQPGGVPVSSDGVGPSVADAPVEGEAKRETVRERVERLEAEVEAMKVRIQQLETGEAEVA